MNLIKYGLMVVQSYKKKLVQTPLKPQESP